MSAIRKNSHWFVLMLGMFCLAGAAGVLAQKQDDLRLPPINDARDLSKAFRVVVERSLPGIVSIQSRGKTVRVNDANENPLFDDNSPFGEIFKNDPRFKEFFKNRPDQRRQVPMGMGSGFVIDPSGVIMTNSHVVQDAEVVTVRLYDGREFIARDIKTDPKSDVAVLHIDAPKDLQALPLGDSSSVQIADWVLAIGSPFGLDLSVTAGIISATGRGPGINEREDYLQTDAAINPGNSGGPLINLNGEVIGINTAISTRSGGYDGVGFAIPINMATWVSGQLMKQGEVHRAYLGVGIQELDDKLARSFGIPVGKGVAVIQVMPNSPASDAKLQEGDIIMKLGDKEIRNGRHLQGTVEQLEMGKTYAMTILRDGEPMDVDITFRPMPKEFSLRGGVKRDPQQEKEETADQVFDNLGFGIAELTPELAQKYGYEETEKGVLITSIQEGSPAEVAGLVEGLIIEKVGNTSISTLAEYQAAIEKLPDGQGVRVLVRSQQSRRLVVISGSVSKKKYIRHTGSP
ncbi:MAG: Do family serine endopeptidase [Planctomycetaceae bacterium]